MPSPLSALTATEPSCRSTRFLATSGSASHLLNTNSSGTCAAPISDEHLAHRRDLALGIGRGAVDDVDEVVAAAGHLERALERLDQSVRQVAHEADRVGDQHRLAAGQRQSASRRIERGEQPILDEHAGMGEVVEQRRLAGVGVADDRHRGEAAATTALALQVAGRGQVFELGFELGDAAHDSPPIDLELGLAGTEP